MKKNEVCSLIRKTAVIPAIRVSSGDDAHFAAESVMNGGIPIVEITLTVPGAVELISHICQTHGKVLVGAGTVLDVETAQKAIDAGAEFITAPGLNPAVVQHCVSQSVVVVPGALTPTEVIAAWNAGGDFVKVFPCAPVGGDKYIKSLSTALPQIPLIAAGGVNQQTAASYILAGATAIGVGTELIPMEAIQKRQSQRIKELARRFTRSVNEARAEVHEWKKSLVVTTYTGTEECQK